MAAPVYSERLGAISDAQFAAAVARLGLGEFVAAKPIAAGLFGQNVFLTTTAGEFVFRGAPHWVRGPDETDFRRNDRVQFRAEAFFVDQVHEHTRAPAPWPYRLDETADIFGWPYAVMPRMPGASYSDRAILKALGAEDRRLVAAALGDTLAALRALTSPFAGGFDVDTIELAPDPGGYTAYVIGQTRRAAVAAQAGGAMTPGDMDWIEALARTARDAGARPNTFVHGDYKLDNMTVVQVDGRWRVGGVLDFHTARFGDGAHDLSRPICAYLDTEPGLARIFIEAYRAAGGDDADLAAWMPLYVANERLMIWSFFAAAEPRPAWARGNTFREWAERYVERILALR